LSSWQADIDSGHLLAAMAGALSYLALGFCLPLVLLAAGYYFGIKYLEERFKKAINTV
jgi:hypothetical protein